MQQEKSMAARRSPAVPGLAAGAAGGGVPQDWTELRGADGVAVARAGAGELPRLLESLRAEAAARHYFGIGAGQLSAEQAAKLAGMVPNPRYYDRNRNAPGLARKTAIILARMPSAEVP